VVRVRLISSELTQLYFSNLIMYKRKIEELEEAD